MSARSQLVLLLVVVALGVAIALVPSPYRFLEPEPPCVAQLVEVEVVHVRHRDSPFASGSVVLQFEDGHREHAPRGLGEVGDVFRMEVCE